MQTVLLDPEAVTASTEMGEVIDAVESAFAAYADGDTQMPAKSYIDLPQHNGDFRSMPAYIETDDWEAAGVKWVNSHADNPERHGLPTVMGTMIYSDPETAFPLALMDGTGLTRLRTGAAAAVATRYLAAEDATSLGLVGAGIQAYTQLEAIAQVRDVQTVVISDLREEAIEAFIDEFAGEFDVREGSITEAASCDIVSTTTPVTEPIVEAVGEHTHINAMGADAPGKNEIAFDVVADATIVIDDYEQCTHSGEINVPWSDGRLDDDDLHGELGDVVTGRVDRPDPDGVTLFDSTGLAIQDVAAARVIYQHATENDIGTEFALVGTDT
ncbi:ornithine cyclodeaminase family protein [Halovenus sp. WSH3]|uniref:Alanine dehydrogenase n=1 Tax=Halovenus carboxidivorans TaxID=2692199 RepID=A0A6B0T212_9EURY|nr:ornithine cyclodeaminase family protein [Halovenus carboxidivorans]MXR50276.1 ornithine cyclodeaminase family protein [Halovenus carboxidivorans]